MANTATQSLGACPEARSAYPAAPVDQRSSLRAPRNAAACRPLPVLCLALLAAGGLTASRARAQDDVHHVVTVAVLTDAPPYSYQAPDGEWQGLAVDLWNLIAAELHFESRLTGVDRGALFDAVASGRARFGIGPLAITPDRSQRVDFSAPFDVTGVAIAVAYVPRGVAHILRDALLSSTFLKLLVGLAALLTVVGTTFWLVERRRNPDFAGRRIHGWGSGVWLSIVTMTTVGYGDKAPRTLGGRVVAALWMFISIALISIFTGTVATLLTVEHVGSRIEGVEDLDRGIIACIKNSAAAQLLAERHLHCLQLDDLDDAIRAVADHRADALVHDRALLAWSLKQRPDLPIRILPGTLWPEYYSFALAPEEPLRRPINEAMARILHGDRWRQFRFAYLGNQAERH